MQILVADIIQVGLSLHCYSSNWLAGQASCSARSPGCAGWTTTYNLPALVTYASWKLHLSDLCRNGGIPALISASCYSGLSSSTLSTTRKPSAGKVNKLQKETTQLPLTSLHIQQKATCMAVEQRLTCWVQVLPATTICAKCENILANYFMQACMGMSCKPLVLAHRHASAADHSSAVLAMPHQPTQQDWQTSPPTALSACTVC